MKKLDIKSLRSISLYLNAKQKIKTLALLSKEWNSIVYSGTAWESLFNPEEDPSWNPIRFNQALITKFKHFKGVKSVYLTHSIICIQKLQLHSHEYNELVLDRSVSNDDILKLSQSLTMFHKIKNLPQSLTKFHIAAYWNRLAAEFDESLDNKIYDSQHQTLLHYAISSPVQSIETIQFLLNKTDNFVMVQDINKRTALHLAVMKNKLNVVKVLVQKIKQSEVIKTSVTSALIQSLTNQNKLRSVINSSDVNMETPLLIATRNNYTEIVQYLLQIKEIDIGKFGYNKETALHVAIMEGFWDIALMLAKKGNLSNVYSDQDLETPIHLLSKVRENAGANDEIYRIIEIILEKLDQRSMKRVLLSRNLSNKTALDLMADKQQCNISKQDSNLIEIVLKYAINPVNTEEEEEEEDKKQEVKQASEVAKKQQGIDQAILLWATK